MKLKGVGRINKKFNQITGERAKLKFVENFNFMLFNPNLIGSKYVIECTLYSFSGKEQFFDQVLSIQSFLKNVGVPKKWIIYSDKSHTQEQLNFLKSFNFLCVMNWDEVIHPSISAVQCSVWQLQKYYCYSGSKISGQSFFLDSDVIFLPRFHDFINSELKSDNWFLADTYPCLNDDYLKLIRHSVINFVNGGFFILNTEIDWQEGNDYILKYLSHDLPVPYFTDQTAMEIVFKTNKLKLLDPRLFSLSLVDHFTFFSDVKHDSLAIRHFVSPIRFRMWQVAKCYNYFT
jgi:hypothetical protein